MEECTDVEVVEETALIQTGVFPDDPIQAFKVAQRIVTEVARPLDNKDFIANIQSKKYPLVSWWTTVGAVLGLFPVVTRCERVDRNGIYLYEADVEVRRNGQVITSATAICSTEEKAWGKRDEYAVKSMAQTRATAKAYRLGLSFLATLAGLEATPAEEVPPQGFGSSKPKTSRPKLTKEQKDLAVRMHDYLLAECEYEDGVKNELGKITETLNFDRTEKFNDMTGEMVEAVWKAIHEKVENFEKATQQ